MSQIAQPVTLLDETIAAGPVEVDGSWYDISTSDKILIFLAITGTTTVTLQLDVDGDGSDVKDLGAFTSDDEKVLDDPTGRIRAVTSGSVAGATALVKIHKVFNRR